VKKLLLAAMLLVGISTTATHAGFLRNTYYRARHRVHYNRGTIGLTVGAIAGSAVTYVLRKPIEKGIEKVWNWIKDKFKK